MTSWQPLDPQEPGPVIFPEEDSWELVANLRGPAGSQGPSGEVVGGATPAYVSEQITAHAIDPTPHPAYDDMPDLVLLLENGLI